MKYIDNDTFARMVVERSRYSSAPPKPKQRLRKRWTRAEREAHAQITMGWRKSRKAAA